MRERCRTAARPRRSCPSRRAVGETSVTDPPATRTTRRFPASVADAISIRETDAIAGSASPRKPKLDDADEIGGGADLRCGVALDREQQLVAIHAAAVVRDADQRTTAVLDRDLDRRGAGVERILDQLLHGGRRPFHDLAGGDLVGDGRRQNRNARRGGVTSRRRSRAVLIVGRSPRVARWARGGRFRASLRDRRRA